MGVNEAPSPHTMSAYTSSAMTTAPAAAATPSMARRWSAENTAPVGLEGLQTTIAAVRASASAATWRKSASQPRSGRSS